MRVSRKPPLETLPAVQDAIARASGELDGAGRIVVRYSGTEPLLRVMVEAESPDRARQVASRLAGVVADALAL